MISVDVFLRTVFDCLTDGKAIDDIEWESGARRTIMIAGRPLIITGCICDEVAIPYGEFNLVARHDYLEPIQNYWVWKWVVEIDLTV